MVGFSVGAKLRLVLRLNETGRAASKGAGYRSANRSTASGNLGITVMLTRLRAGCSNGRLRESSRFPEADASGRPGGATDPQPAAAASRLCRARLHLDEWAR